ncbi:MAG: hypothetical protein HY356_02760 [Gammaproteobacteria bacterium]|nr:hypothetical protein [Gammaproteobacteria bacterium]
MSWSINCSNQKCGSSTWASNIDDLLKHHVDNKGWFTCSTCKSAGYIEKSYELQEIGSVWNPFLRGVVPLGTANDTYQPFVFLVSNSQDGPIDDFWFCYYKDTRQDGGKLKLGYGPGGPPVLSSHKLLALIQKLLELKCLPKSDLDKILRVAPQ